MPVALLFSDPFIFVSDLNRIATGKQKWEPQEDLNAIQKWVETNKMDVAMEKYTKVKLWGKKSSELKDVQLRNSAIVKEVGIQVSSKLTWKRHVEECLMNANKVLYLLGQIAAMGLPTTIKLISTGP